MQLIWGDCIEEMKKLPNKSIDLCLTDPPYGKRSARGTNGFGSSRNRKYSGSWDNSIPSGEIFNEIARISKHQIIFGGNYFSHLLAPSKCWIVWDKKGDVGFKNPFADCELIYTSFTKPIKKYVFKQQGFITDSKDKRYHPTQKPTELIMKIIADYSDAKTIIDPFMGSGTTGVVCKNLNRDFIGIELDKEYFEIAKERINAFQQR